MNRTLNCKSDNTGLIPDSELHLTYLKKIKNIR